MFKNIVFDVGDVLVDFRYRAYMADLGFSDEVIDLFSDNMVMTEYWHRLDLNEVNEEDALIHFSKEMPQYQREVELFWKKIEAIVSEFPYAGSLVRGLKEKGYAVYLLSNYPKRLSDVHFSKFTFRDVLDGKVVSGHEGVSKPDPAIYHRLEEKYGIRLDESIFIDDRGNNVEAARKLGMDGILFTGYEDLIAELKQRDITIQ